MHRNLGALISGSNPVKMVDVITDCKFNIAKLEVEVANAQKRVLRGKPSSSWFLIFRFVNNFYFASWSTHEPGAHGPGFRVL